MKSLLKKREFPLANNLKNTSRSPTNGDSVAPSPPAPVIMHTAPRPGEDGPLVEIIGPTCSPPPAPGMRTAPGLREDGRLSAAVGSSRPAPGILVAPGPGKDDCMIAAVASPPRAPGVPGPPGPRVNDTSRKFPLRVNDTSLKSPRVSQCPRVITHNLAS